MSARGILPFSVCLVAKCHRVAVSVQGLLCSLIPGPGPGVPGNHNPRKYVS